MSKEPAGLFAQGQRIHLYAVGIQVKALGVAAEVTLTQRYRNEEAVPVEAVYSFPLEESCAVTRFEVEIGGKRVVGKIEEREKAFEQYDEAMAQGHGAFLLDQDRPNIFTAGVGNLLAQQEALLRLSYVAELEQSADRIRLMIPTTISPRYVPAKDVQTMDPAELDRINPPTVLGPLPYGLSLEVELELPGEAKEVACPSHPARISFSGKKVKVTLAGDNIQLDQDFVLEVTLAQPHQAGAVVARDGEAKVVLLNLYPDLKEFERSPSEFIFVVDRSGSMGDESITQARNALLLALRSMEEGDRFNIIGFGDKYQALFKSSMPYEQKYLDEATRHVEQMDADLGGTELLKPLQFVLESKSESPRLVVLLTDGQVGNEAECHKLAGKYREQARIFPFGIGRGVSEHLVRGLARASGGQAEFIHPGERIEPKVMRQFARMASPQLKNVQVEWGALKTDLQAPAQCPPLFDGDRLALYARVIEGLPCEAAVTAEAVLPNGEVKKLRFPVWVDLERACAVSFIPVLMARKAIQDLEEGRGIGAAGSNQHGRRESSVKREILKLALQYQLMSSETSFVAVEERAPDGQTQPAQLRRIPIALTKNWGTTAGALSACRLATFGQIVDIQQCLIAAPPPSVRGRGRGVFHKFRHASGSLGKNAPASPNLPGDMAITRESPFPEMLAKSDSGEPTSSGDIFLLLTKGQRADGSFELEKALLEAVGLLEADPAWKALGSNRALAQRVLATLLALRIFEEQYMDREVEWKLLAAKARRWMNKQQVAIPGGFASLRAWADSLGT
jgi:Ca-activated chloride channel family protein